MERRRRFLTDWKMIGALVAVLAIGFTVAYFRANAVPYRFLEDHKPFHSKIEKEFGDTVDVQGYSWNGDFIALREEMQKELEPLGLQPDLKMQGWFDEYFRHPNGLTVGLKMGMSSTREDIFVWKLGKDLKGVTIVVARPLPDNWITKVRVWLQSK